MCCNTNECSTAIFESKATQSCFMFDCRQPGQCFYSSHSNYDTIVLEESNGNQSLKNKVGLNQHCDSNNVCDEVKTICSDGICICQSGWIAKKGSCVQSVCKSPDLQFQCDDSSTCVAIYDKCNGIVECPDGSDELFCPSRVIHKQNETNPSLPRNQKQGEFDGGILSKPSNASYQPLERYQSSQPSFLTTSRSTSPALIDLHDLSDPLFYTTPPNYHNDREQQTKSHPIKSANQKPLFNVDDKEPFMLDINNKISENNDNNAEMFFTSSDDVGWHYPKGLYHDVSSQGGSDILSQSLPRKHLYRPDHHHHHSILSRMKPYETAGLYRPRSFNAFKVDYPQSSQRNELSFIPYQHSNTFMHGSHQDEPPFFQYNRDRKHQSEMIIDPTVLENMDFINKLSETSDTLKKYPLVHEPKYIHHRNEFDDISQKGSSIDKSENRQATLISTSSPITTTDSSQSIIAAVKESQSEGHTSALLLAFSLGLICCFIGLLIAEWRRRQKLHLWSSHRSRPEQAIVFGDRTKISMPRLKPSRRLKKNTTYDQVNKTITGTIDEEKALFSDLVL
ncbi:hypothetical protein Smp_143480 [Schistosoma mansoni]|uniref:hypothetical protein n=1 Tax=Schistosoma mansoni TaxID=6183 RepID=UPI0001A64353|nr:hypothetical protein Smp_143480 [Schistosoma mansoni]|eukprot:XP_018650538.1 hypothetical protein Smp_143480 [Schistosoma mansoni]